MIAINLLFVLENLRKNFFKLVSSKEKKQNNNKNNNNNELKSSKEKV